MKSDTSAQNKTFDIWSVCHCSEWQEDKTGGYHYSLVALFVNKEQAEQFAKKHEHEYYERDYGYEGEGWEGHKDVLIAGRMAVRPFSIKLIPSTGHKEVRRFSINSIELTIPNENPTPDLNHCLSAAERIISLLYRSHMDIYTDYDPKKDFQIFSWERAIDFHTVRKELESGMDEYVIELY